MANHPLDNIDHHSNSNGTSSNSTMLNPESPEFTPYVTSTIREHDSTTSNSTYLSPPSSYVESASRTTEPTEEDYSDPSYGMNAVSPLNDGPAPLEQEPPPNYHDLTPTDLAVYLEDDLSPAHIPGQPSSEVRKIHSLRLTTYLFDSEDKLLVLQNPTKSRSAWALPSRRFIFPQTGADRFKFNRLNKLDPRDKSVEEIARHLVKDAIATTTDCEVVGKDAEDGILYLAFEENLSLPETALPPHMRAIKKAGGKKAFDRMQYRLDPSKKWDQEREQQSLSVWAVSVAVILRCPGADLSRLKTDKMGQFTLDGGMKWQGFHWCELKEADALMRGEWVRAGLVRSVFERNASERTKEPGGTRMVDTFAVPRGEPLIPFYVSK